MAVITITIGEELSIRGPLVGGGCLSVLTTSYLGDGPDRFVFERDVIHFHARSLVTLRSFVEKLLEALPEPTTQVEDSATQVEAETAASALEGAAQ